MKTIALSILILLLPATSQGAPTSAPSGPEAILAEIDALPRPDFDDSKKNDAAYVKQYTEQMNKTWKRQDELALELYRRFPDYPQAETLLVARWLNRLTRGYDPSSVNQEVQQYLKNHPDGPHSARAQRLFVTVQQRLAEGQPDRLRQIAEAFAKAHPRNEIGAGLFLTAANAIKDADARHQLYRRIMLDYPDSGSAILAGGKLRQISQIGMPFELGFFDAMKNQWVYSGDLKGKVIIVDFWATWCAPCRGEIPHLKELYAKYKSKGLQIISVSLDGPRERTGLETLQKFVKQNQIEWPQYYQGDGFDSAFSRSWGINAIPAVFLVDREGRLRSTDAPREKLDQLIPEMLGAAKEPN